MAAHPRMRRDSSPSPWAPCRSASSCRCTSAAPEADFGASLASGTRTAAFFRERARADETDGTARAITRLFGEMDAEVSPLRDIVGRKLMLEYDVGSVSGRRALRTRGCSCVPANARLSGHGGQVDDVGTVVDALVSCVGVGEERRREGERKTGLPGAAGGYAPGFVRCLPVPRAVDPPGGHGLQGGSRTCRAWLENHGLARSDSRPWTR